METEQRESPSPSSTEAKPEQVPHSEPVATEEEFLAIDPSQLVERLVEAGEWPPPELLEQIVRAGDASVEPLIAVLRSRPRGWPAEAPLDAAMGLLGMLRPPAAIPELIEVVKCYNNATANGAADALVDFGTPGFEALVELCQDPSIKGYQRNSVMEAAVVAAGEDLDQTSRLADVLRPILEDRIAKAREELRRNGFVAKLPPEDELLDDDEDEELDELDEPDDDDPIDEDLIDEEEHEEEFQPHVSEELAFVVGALADLGDEAAYDLIKTAFREGLVDEEIVGEPYVDDSYGGGVGEPPAVEPTLDWLSGYRQDYAAHIEELTRPKKSPPINRPRPKYRYEDPDEMPELPLDIPVTAPIRNTAPKLGRNDPCWCGSGKKFKKCHLGKDTPVEPDR